VTKKGISDIGRSKVHSGSTSVFQLKTMIGTVFQLDCFSNPL